MTKRMTIDEGRYAFLRFGRRLSLKLVDMSVPLAEEAWGKIKELSEGKNDAFGITADPPTTRLLAKKGGENLRAAAAEVVKGGIPKPEAGRNFLAATDGVREAVAPMVAAFARFGNDAPKECGGAKLWAMLNVEELKTFLFFQTDGDIFYGERFTPFSTAHGAYFSVLTHSAGLFAEDDEAAARIIGGAIAVSRLWEEWGKPDIVELFGDLVDGDIDGVDVEAEKTRMRGLYDKAKLAAAVDELAAEVGGKVVKEGVVEGADGKKYRVMG